jgi:PAS domain S-box-containing protein
MDDRLSQLEAELARVRAERDRLAVALQRAALFERAVAASPVAVMCVDTETMRLEFANEAYAELHGRSLAEIWATDPYEVWVEHTLAEDLAVERALVAEMAKGDIDSYDLERRVLRRGGEVRWVRVTAVGFREASGRLARLALYFADIHELRAAATGRDRLEAQLRQVQKLEALGKVAGGVAHDFNNRLVVIMGYMELLRGALPEGSELARHAEAVLGSAQRGAELTRQLLAYSGRQLLRPEAVDLNQIVDRMRGLLEGVIGDRIQLATMLGASHAAFCDPGQVEQVILNLAINARDAMPDGGRLTLETGDASVAAGEDQTLPAGEYVTLAVGDQGIGITDDVLPHIFEPFFTTKPLGQGTGLGLSMVEGIARQSGGAVRVSTRVAHGTTFTLYLPSARVAAPAARRAAVMAPPQDGRHETVLVCDDDDNVRRLLVDVLGLRAYRILQARNGQEALDVVARHDGTIHLLVTDLVMPGLAGTALAAELRRRRPALRVLYVSGYAEDAWLLSGPLGPDTQFLAKPFLPGDLTQAVKAMLENRTSA